MVAAPSEQAAQPMDIGSLLIYTFSSSDTVFDLA
jgi:hypothetical protein